MLRGFLFLFLISFGISSWALSWPAGQWAGKMYIYDFETNKNTVHEVTYRVPANSSEIVAYTVVDGTPGLFTLEWREIENRVEIMDSSGPILKGHCTDNACFFDYVVAGYEESWARYHFDEGEMQIVEYLIVDGMATGMNIINLQRVESGLWGSEDNNL